MAKQMNWVEVAPDHLIRHKKYSAPPKLETIHEEDHNLEFMNVTKRAVYFLPLLLFVGSFLVLFSNFENLKI